MTFSVLVCFSFYLLFTTILYLLLNIIHGVFILVMAEAIAGAFQVIKALECLTSLASPPEVSGTSHVW